MTKKRMLPLGAEMMEGSNCCYVLKIFLIWTIFKVFIEFVATLFVATLLLFCVLVFLAEGHVGSWPPTRD